MYYLRYTYCKSPKNVPAANAGSLALAQTALCAFVVLGSVLWPIFIIYITLLELNDTLRIGFPSETSEVWTRKKYRSGDMWCGYCRTERHLGCLWWEGRYPQASIHFNGPYLITCCKKSLFLCGCVVQTLTGCTKGYETKSKKPVFSERGWATNKFMKHTAAIYKFVLRVERQCHTGKTFKYKASEQEVFSEAEVALVKQIWGKLSYLQYIYILLRMVNDKVKSSNSEKRL